MTLQSSGAISLLNVQNEFGGSAPISMSEYYRGAGTTTNNTGVPASGTISMSQFYGTHRFVPTSGTWDQTVPGTYTLPIGENNQVVIQVWGGGGAGGSGQGLTGGAGGDSVVGGPVSLVAGGGGGGTYGTGGAGGSASGGNQYDLNGFQGTSATLGGGAGGASQNGGGGGSAGTSSGGPGAFPGGGGGGANASGGGGGGYVQHILSGQSEGYTFTITVGAGGTVGTYLGATGGAGGNGRVLIQWS